MVYPNNSIQCRVNSQYRFFEDYYPKGPSAAYPKSSMEPMELSSELIIKLSKPVSADEVIDIRNLLKKGANPNACDSVENCPIHLAIDNSPSNTQLVLEIINFGADINAANIHGATALCFSLQKKAHKTTELLLKRGIDINFGCKCGWKPLMIATRINDLWAVRMLLEHGANVNAYDKKNRTALMFAVERCNLEIIKELLDYGANPAMRDYKNMTALGIHINAREYLNLDVVNVLLLHCASFEGLKTDDETSFMQIMRKCDRERNGPYHACVKTLIKIYVLLTYPHHNFFQNQYWYDLSESCISEIRYMRINTLAYSYNVYDLLRRSLCGQVHKESNLECLLTFVANNDSLFYSDMLRTHFQKPFLIKKFLSLTMFSKKEGRNEKVVFLSRDLNPLIMSYLSTDDMLQFVLAAYLNTNSSGKFHKIYDCLYPEGKSYNMSQIMDMN